MGPIFKAQVQNLVRNPWAVLIMVGLTVVISFLFGYQATSIIEVGVVHGSDMSEAETTEWLELLNRSETFRFVLEDEETLLAFLATNASGLGVRLGAEDWQVLAAENEPNAPLLASYVGRVYTQELGVRAAAEQAGRGVAEMRAALAERMAEPALSVRASAVEAATDFEYNPRVHTLLGMGLFFASFTIMFGVNNILEERRIGVWDRVIYSPTTRLSMYSGHLLYVYLLGFAQITVIFAVFRYVFGVPLGANIGGSLVIIAAYTFAIVALGLLLAGLVGNAQRMNVVVPIVCVSSAMLGGAQWPLEIVSSKILLSVANFVPIRHAMDALKGIAYYDYGWSALLWPFAVLVLFGVVFMGVGLRLVERRG
jgi:ABC-2 type transport system permease protein